MDSSGRVYISKDVIFYEYNFPYKSMFPTSKTTPTLHYSFSPSFSILFLQISDSGFANVPRNSNASTCRLVNPPVQSNVNVVPHTISTVQVVSAGPMTTPLPSVAGSLQPSPTF